MRNLKKVIALIAVFAMMVSTVAFAQTFGDVTDGDNYYEAIETLNKLGILTGDDENNDGVMEYRPNDSITRAEITVIVARIQGQTGAVAQANTVFTDVPSTYWASGYIASATNQGIINGYGDGTFGPEDKVLYEDVIKMLMETLGYKPYAANNGGYPTGYILAAQRQGVLKNVVGAAEGTQATRGQVAQMTYNAIDTPLMERYVYGGQDQYVIWDGDSWSPRKTLMNQALGINKIKGIVVENDVTALDTAVQIDTDAKQTVRVYVEDNYLGTNATNPTYEIDSIYTFYVGNSNANEYLGYDVVLYAVDNKNETDEIISMTEATGRNTKVSFTLDKFNSYDPYASNLSYMKNDTDKSATKLKIQTTSGKNNLSVPSVIYNGIAYDGSLESLFGSYEGDQSGLIWKDSAYSGDITLLDNDDVSGYDVIFVNVAVGGVVDELTNRGVVTFKNSVGDKKHMNSVTKIEFDSSNTDISINLTKNGQPFDYTALNSWDVLSIVANTVDAQSYYYDIEVLDNTAITGTISRTSSSDTSADGTAYTINGVDYDLAEGFYNNGSLKAGATGKFFVDAYGKIVAYNKDAGSVNTDNYGYILDAQIASSGFSDNVPSLQIIYKNNSVMTFDYASTVTIENPSAVIRAIVDPLAKANDSVTFKYKDFSAEDISTILSEMVGTLVTLNATDGYIKSITMAVTSTTTDDNTLVLERVDTAYGSSYDEDTNQIKVNGRKYDVADDTAVFFIGKPGDEFKYNEPANGEPVEDCKVSTGSELKSNDYFCAAIYRNGDAAGQASVIVMYNTDPGMGASQGIAYVTAIGQSTVDGTKVLSVSYYQDGKFNEAVTDDIFVGDLDASTVPGSLFKFGFTGTTITSATSYLTFNGSVRDKIIPGQDFTVKGIPNVREVMTLSSNSDEDLYFGAVIQKSGSRLTLAPLASSGVISVDPEDWTSVSLSSFTANYYLYDPTRTGKAKFQTGSLGDILAEKQLTNNGGNGATNGNYVISYGGVDEYAPAFGMLDYAYVRTYKGNADVVNYGSWEYEYDFYIQ